MIGLSVWGQNSSPAGQIKSTTSLATAAGRQATAISNLNKASCVIGMMVQDSNGKTLGKVQDLVIDLENNKLGYAVLSLGNNRMVPVPITALKPAESKDHFVLNMSSALLAAAPGVTNDEWPAVDTFAVGGPAGAETGQGSSESSNKTR